MAQHPPVICKTRTLVALSLGVILVYPLAACSKEQDSNYGKASTQQSAAVSASSPMITADMPTATATSQSSTSAAYASDSLTLGNNIINQQQQQQQQQTNSAFGDKKMLVSAKATFQVKDLQQSANQIEALTRQHGSYIASSQISNNDHSSNSYPIGNYQLKELINYSRRATMLLRLPKQQVGDSLQKPQQYIAFLDSSQFSAKDVTLEIQKAQVEAQIQAAKTAQIA